MCYVTFMLRYSECAQSLDPGSGEGPRRKSIKYGEEWELIFGLRSLNAG
jgi:hypothetical protein